MQSKITTRTKKVVSEDAEDNLDEKGTALWQAYRSNGCKDEEQGDLVEYYLPLVVRQLERLSIRVSRHVDRRELLGAGVLGLHRAISRYRRNRQGKTSNFTAFAARHIHGAIIDELRRLDPLTRDQRRHYHRICEAIANFTQEQKKHPTLDQIASAVGMNVANVNMYLQLGQGTVSLQQTNDHEIPLQDLLPDDNAQNPCTLVDHRLTRETLRQCYKKLPVREQKLLYLRLYEGLRVSEIAVVLGISEGRVSQIYNETVDRLRDMMLVS